MAGIGKKRTEEEEEEEEKEEKEEGGSQSLVCRAEWENVNFQSSKMCDCFLERERQSRLVRAMTEARNAFKLLSSLTLL